MGSSLVRWILAEAIPSQVTHVDSDITRYYERLYERMPQKRHGGCGAQAPPHRLLDAQEEPYLCQLLGGGECAVKGCRPKAAAAASTPARGA